MSSPNLLNPQPKRWGFFFATFFYALLACLRSAKNGSSHKVAGTNIYSESSPEPAGLEKILR